MKISLNFIQPLTLVQLYKYITDYTYIESPSAMIIYELSVPKDEILEVQIIPNGCIQFIFGYNIEGTSLITIIGAMKEIKAISLKNYTHYFWVQFNPGILYYNEKVLPQFSTITSKNYMQRLIYPSIIFNEILSLTFDDSKLKSESNLISEFRNTNDFYFKLKLFLTYLQTDLKKCDISEAVQYALTRIKEEKNIILISQIAEELNYSVRHINRLFTDCLGFGPKDYCKYIRFQNALNEIITNPMRNNSEFIHNIGYSDQSHFQREFKSFTKITPKKYIAHQLAMQNK